MPKQVLNVLPLKGEMKFKPVNPYSIKRLEHTPRRMDVASVGERNTPYWVL